MQTARVAMCITSSPSSADRRTGQFCDKLTAEARDEFRAMQQPREYAGRSVLFSEKQAVDGIYLVVSGEVKISMNSMDGKRLILRIARAGEMPGLASAISGHDSEITAETLHPARIALIERNAFLGFLRRHPEAYAALTVELSQHVNMVCEQLRTVGLSASAPEKLARLLLEWSENGQTTDQGTKFLFPLTHEEIGEFIGTSRETVTRTLSVFRNRRLVSFHGATLTIPNRIALEDFARC